MLTLEAKEVYCGYDGKDVVKGLSLEVKSGELMAVTGVNGCGKTTLLRAFAGIIGYKGSIKLSGREIRDYSRTELSAKTALLTQTSAAGDYAEYTVEETVLMGRYARKKGLLSGITALDKAAAEECMEKSGITELKDKKITELSGGQLQRVFLARAFAQEPEIILLDEPTNHLDQKHRFELMTMLRDWISQGKSAVGVFHDLGFAAAVSDETAVIDEGKCVLFGNSKEVCRSEMLSEIYGFDIKSYMKSMLELWN